MEIFEYLIYHGANIHYVDEMGVGLLDEAITNKRADLVLYLLNHGLNVNDTKRSSKISPLMLCACYNNVEIADILIAFGADKFAKDSNGLTALDYAKMLWKHEMIEFLS